MPLINRRAHLGRPLRGAGQGTGASVRDRWAAMTAYPERGGFVVELVWLMPLLIFMLFAGLQFGLWHDARATCTGAAAAGAAAASGAQAAPGAGTAAARAFLAGPSGSSVLEPAITEQPGATTVAVTCSGHSAALIPIPGMSLSFTQTATAPKERWVTP